MTLTAIAVFAGALASVMPIGALLVIVCVVALALYRFAYVHGRGPSGTFVGRRRTCDVSFLGQSPSGIIGRMTRSVPAPKVVPGVNDGTNPVPYFGLAVMETAQNTVRGILASDAGAAAIAGVAAQPFPFQPSSGTNYGAQPFSNLTAVPPGIVDVNRSGFQTVYCNNAQNATTLSPVYVWVAASTGNHVQGGFEIAASATIAGVANVGNTGNGTISAGPTVTAGVAENGAYSVIFTGATTFDVIDPNGRQLKAGATGVAYLDGGIGFTITAGGVAFVAGDGFTITVTNQTIQLDSKSYFNGPGDATGAIELGFNL